MKEKISQLLALRSALNTNGCVEWVGAKNDRGYGQIRCNLFGKRKAWYVHRLSWWVNRGEIPSSNICICHSCDNPSCINPDHLFLGTKLDNHRDMVSKGRAVYVSRPGSKNPTAKLVESDVQFIRKMYGVYNQTELANMFSVHKSLISLIITRKTWKHI